MACFPPMRKAALFELNEYFEWSGKAWGPFSRRPDQSALFVSCGTPGTFRSWQFPHTSRYMVPLSRWSTAGVSSTGLASRDSLRDCTSDQMDQSGATLIARTFAPSWPSIRYSNRTALSCRWILLMPAPRLFTSSPPWGRTLSRRCHRTPDLPPVPGDSATLLRRSWTGKLVGR